MSPAPKRRERLLSTGHERIVDLELGLEKLASQSRLPLRGFRAGRSEDVDHPVDNLLRARRVWRGRRRTVNRTPSTLTTVSYAARRRSGGAPTTKPSRSNVSGNESAGASAATATSPSRSGESLRRSTRSRRLREDFRRTTRSIGILSTTPPATA